MEFFVILQMIQYNKKQLIMIAYRMRIIVILISLFSFLFLFKEKKTIFPILKFFIILIQSLFSSLVIYIIVKQYFFSMNIFLKKKKYGSFVFLII